MPVRPRRKWWTPLGLALLCGHCVLGGAAVAASALGLAVLPSFWGVSLAYVLPPVTVFSLFGLWLWSGRPREEACLLPGEGAVKGR